MPYSVIDAKSQVTKIAAGLEKLTVTLTLLETNPKTFGLSYKIKYSGVQSGEAEGGPFNVDGNSTQIVHEDPTITCEITNYSLTNTQISMHINITADLPKVGTKTVFDDVLEGQYGTSPTLLILNHMSNLSK